MSTSEMKLCPYCGEEIRAIAIKCKHCQSMLEGSGGGVASEPAGRGSSSGNGSSSGRGTEGAVGTGGGSRLAPGVRIGGGRFELTRLLGQGGMGEVFLAEHTYTGQKVALKAVWPNLMASEGPRKRFLQEGRVLAKLKHPNIVGLTDFFEEDGRFFLVMEYVEGETLGAYLQRVSGRGEAIPFIEFARVVGGVLKGLSHAHAQTPFVVHRDIKPANVMLAKDGRVVLMDFGIARVAGGEKITSTAGVVGTYEYMSPEQVSGQAITPASDVYAVGILAYELLTGDVPFPQKSDSGYEAMEGHRYKAPPPIQERRPDCPPALVAWVEKALAKSPTERFRDAGEMLRALGKVNRTGLGQGDVVVEVPKPSQSNMVGSSREAKHLAQESAIATAAGNGGSRRKWWGVGALLIGVAVVGAFGVWSGSGRVEMKAPNRSISEKRETKKEEKKAGEQKPGEAWPREARKAEEDKRNEEPAPKGPAGLEWVYSSPAKLFFSRSEVTVAQYRACVEAGACSAENHRTKTEGRYCNWGHSDRDQHPMNCVNWHGADQFCTWAGGRLPSEEEWYAEASNGGTREYPWGDEAVTCETAIWGGGPYRECRLDHTWSVCSKTAGNSVSGLCDMSGNVWEWTSSEKSSERVLRGGSWFPYEALSNLQASGRMWLDPGWLGPSGNYSVQGVRCVRVSQ